MSFDSEGADLESHIGALHADVATHLQSRVKEVGEALGTRRRLYLDTRYWVFLRDAWLGRAKKPEHLTILECLQWLVRKGLAVCPVSDVAFMELTGQTDDVTRAATAALLDELSLKVALQTERERGRQELEHFFRHPREASARAGLALQSFTRPCFVFGPAVPSFQAVPADIAIALQKAYIDTVWNVTFSDLARESTAHMKEASPFDRTAEGINVDMRNFQHEVPTFDKAFFAEIAGVVGLFLDAIGAIGAALYREQGVASGQMEDVVPLQVRDVMVRAVVNAFLHARRKAATRMPTLYCHAVCHAAIRMDIKRKFNGNFLRDLHHGAAAAAYHDAMFTEKPLRVLMTSGNVALDKMFGCRVFSEEAQVLEYLSDLK